MSDMTSAPTAKADGIEFRGVLQEHSDDCVRACVASLFQLPVSDVPRFAPETWGEELEPWLNARGFGFINVAFTGEQKDGLPRGLTIGAIPSVDFSQGWMHCVVCLDGQIIWDPKTGRQTGSERAREYTVIYLLDPIATDRDEQPDDPLAIAEKALLLAARWFKLCFDDETLNEYPPSKADLAGMLDAIQDAREAINRKPKTAN